MEGAAGRSLIKLRGYLHAAPQGYFCAGPLGVLAEYVSSAEGVAAEGDRTAESLFLSRFQVSW